MSCKLLGRFVIEASVLLGDPTVASQIPQLLDCYLLMDSINRASDDIHSWRRMAFSESKHERYCCTQTWQAVDTQSNHLIDS